MRSARTRSRPGRRGICLTALAALAGAHAALAQGTPARVYEYVYPYNTPDLIENHTIELDASGATPRGWYYGTSDEFDQAREGYLPGFFVAPMSNLMLTESTISFTLDRPDRLFVAPVPLEYRSADDVPEGLIEEWTVSLPNESRSYHGVASGDDLVLDVAGGARVFRRRSTP
jgi:hypothetical protein